MSDAFSIAVVDWLSTECGTREDRRTSALLRVACGEHIATRVEDDWSQSVHPHVRLSAYLMAMWFAGSWWRLRWEPAPEGQRSPDWRMSHELRSSGGGILWPPLLFESDSESIDVSCLPTVAVREEPVRYIESFRVTVPGETFEQAVDAFIGLVIARLQSAGQNETRLLTLWNDVLEERRDPDAFFYRRLEASLGFDPDEAPEPLIAQLQRMAATTGREAIEEIAPACTGANPGRTLTQVLDFSRTEGLRARPDVPDLLVQAARESRQEKARPWERGWQLANRARAVYGLEHRPVTTRDLSEILGMGADALENTPRPSSPPPMGLAVRQDADVLNLLLRRRPLVGRRFETARLLADHLLAADSDTWLPTTDLKTARQKSQRAFAAEFLCPIAAIEERLQGDFSEASIDEAGEHFGVSPLAVRSHLVNHGVLPRFYLDDAVRSESTGTNGEHPVH